MEEIDEDDCTTSYLRALMRQLADYEELMGEDSEKGVRPVFTLPAAKKTATRTPIPARRIGSTRMRMGRGMTVDSGAADNVMPRRMVRGKHSKLRPSPGSRAGVHYLAADNARIRNEGETDFKFQTKEGEEESWTFQIAAVNKVLCAVSYLVDHDMRVIFDRDEATGVDTSHIMHKKTGKTIKMNRERNVWTIEAYIDEGDDEDIDTAPFARRG